jgi:hypothetical protein
MTLKIEGMIMGIPNNNGTNSSPNNAGTNSTKNPIAVRRLIPNIDNPKRLLLIENIPAVKPNAKTRIPKIPMSTQNKPTKKRIPMKRARQEAMIARMPAAIGKPVLFLDGDGGGSSDKSFPKQ